MKLIDLEIFSHKVSRIFSPLDDRWCIIQYLTSDELNAQPSGDFIYLYNNKPCYKLDDSFKSKEEANKSIEYNYKDSKLSYLSVPRSKLLNQVVIYAYKKDDEIHIIFGSEE